MFREPLSELLAAAPPFVPHPSVVERVARAICDADDTSVTSYENLALAAIAAFLQED
jgi:hypothetical protein